MIGKRLKELRINKRLRQLDVAEFLGVSRTTLTHYETGDTEPDIDTIIKLAHYFDVSSDYLLGRMDDHNHNSKIKESEVTYTLNVDGLPDEAIRQVEEYIELIKLKYNTERTKG